jgi:hypothetical protein
VVLCVEPSMQQHGTMLWIQHSYRVATNCRTTSDTRPMIPAIGDQRQCDGYLVALKSAVRLLGIEDLTTRPSSGYNNSMV